MTVYYVTLAAVVVLCYIAQNQDYEIKESHGHITARHSQITTFFFIICSGVLIIVSGFRYRVGTDYLNYYLSYKNYISSLRNSIFSLDEPGLGILAWFITRFRDSGTAVIFFAAFVTVSLPMLIIYRNTDRLLLAAYLLIVMGFWHGSFNGIRQYLAAAVLFCGFRYLKDKQLIKYCIAVFVAFLFHRSAIVMIALYFAVHRKINIINLLILFIATWIILFSYERVFAFANFIMEKNYSMNNAYTATIVNRIRVISACIPAIVFLFAYWNKAHAADETVYLNLTIIHAAIRVFTMNSALLYRIGIYTLPFQLIAIPELLKGISPRNRGLITAGFIMMYTGMWWYELQGSGALNNFKFIWQ